MNLSRLKLITFDVTDTLLKFRVNLGKQYSDIGKLHGVSCDEKLLVKNFKSNWSQLKKEHPNFGRNSGISWEEWWTIIVHRTFTTHCNNTDNHFTAEKLDAIAATLIETYKSAACWRDSVGSTDLLLYLTNHKKTLGVISNFDTRLPILLHNSNLSHYFKFILTSYEAGIEKPQPGIFRNAQIASNIERIQPSECLHIGNTPIEDYIGAKKAGWNAILISNHIQVKNNDINPKHVFNTLADLHQKFVDLNDF